MSQVIANALSYTGVNSTNPPKLTFQKRVPTANDNQNFNIGDQWLINNVNLAPPIQIWVLGSLTGSISGPAATWVQVYPGTSGGSITFDTPNGNATETGGVITFTNSDGNVVTSGVGSTVDFKFNTDTTITGAATANFMISNAGFTTPFGNLDFPITTNDVNTGGYITQAGNQFINSYGTNNTFMGTFSGNPVGMTTASTDNTGIGFFSLGQLTTGAFNVAVGSGSMVSAITDNNTTAVGYQTLLNASGTANNAVFGANSASNLLTGNNNCIVGTSSGVAYTGAESNNLILGNSVVGTTGESNTLRIGNGQTKSFIAGVQGVTINPATINNVTIDTSTGQLGSQAPIEFHATGGGAAVPNGNIINFAGAGGTTVTASLNTVTITGGGGGGGGVNFTTSSGATGTVNAVTLTGAAGITITSVPGGPITFSGGGGGGGTVATLTGNSGGAIPPDGGGNINIIGLAGNPVTVAGAGNTLTVAITDPLTVAHGGTGVATLTNHGVLVGSGTSAVTSTAAGTLHTVLMGQGAATPAYSTSTYPVTATQGSILYANAANTITTLPKSATATSYLANTGASNNPVWDYVNLGNGVTGTLPKANGGTGGTASGVNFTATTGGSTGVVDAVTLAAGTNMTVTRAGGTITFASTGGGGACNTVCTVNNTGYGQGSMAAAVTGTTNSAYGAQSLAALTSGTGNIAIGYQALNNTTSASSNIAIGGLAGSSITTQAAGNNVMIGVLSGNFLTTGTLNTFIGNQAGSSIATGLRNTFLGASSGQSHNLADSDNINIGYGATTASGTSNTLKIGISTGTGVGQINSASIAGITGKTTAGGIGVLVNSSDLLGTTTSSRRFKQNIKDMGSHSDRLHQLRPVTFNRPEFPDYIEPGLIAEEVYEVMPQIVTHNKDNEIDSVQYHLLPAMLLNELQKQSKLIEKLNKRIEVLEGKI